MQPTDKGTAAAYPLKPALATTAAALLILFMRRPECFRQPQFFAEDGPVFFMGAHRDPLGSILAPYAGYLHVAGRLVASACSGLDPLWVPTAYFAACMAAVAALCLCLFSRRVGLPRPVLLALVIVLIPHTGEVFDNLTNLQWMVALGLIVLLVAGDPSSPAQCSVDLAFALVASLSGVFSVLLAPLFAIRAFLRGTRPAAAVACVVCAGAAVQAREILGDAAAPAANTLTAFLTLSTFGQRVWMSLLAPPHAVDASPLWLRACFGIAGAAVLLALCLRSGALRAERIGLAAVLLLIVAASLFRFRGSIESLGRVENGDRYFFVPKVALAWLLAAQLGGALPLRRLSLALLAAMALNTCLAFRYERWSDLNWAYWADRIDQGERVVVPINPPGFSFVYDGDRPP
jgi:hypothetical protein